MIRKKNQIVRHSNSEELSPARWWQSCFRFSLWGCVAWCTGQRRSKFISCWESRGTSFRRDKLAIRWKGFERVFLSWKKKLLIKTILVRALGKHSCWPKKERIAKRNSFLNGRAKYISTYIPMVRSTSLCTWSTYMSNLFTSVMLYMRRNAFTDLLD